MTRILTIAAVLLALGCARQEADAPAAEENAAAPSAPAAAEVVPTLEGRWRAAAIDGKPVAGAMTASFAGGKASISSGCFRRAWDYTQKRNMVAFTTSPGGSSNCGGQAPGTDEESAYAVIDGANIAVFGKGGKEATLSGTGGTLTLAR